MECWDQTIKSYQLKFNIVPNWVLNRITTKKEHLGKLKKISKTGIARYYKPMPEELKNTRAPQKITKENTQEDIDQIIMKYGVSDWYDWAVSNWGTKWGCCENEIENDEYWYKTAWAPLSLDLLKMLSKDIPEFNYTWEEEQGFGQDWVCKNGQLKMIKEWGLD